MFSPPIRAQTHKMGPCDSLCRQQSKLVPYLFICQINSVLPPYQYGVACPCIRFLESCHSGIQEHAIDQSHTTRSFASRVSKQRILNLVTSLTAREETDHCAAPVRPPLFVSQLPSPCSAGPFVPCRRSPNMDPPLPVPMGVFILNRIVATAYQFFIH
ncbi:hypothetical protein BDW22DRAFT_853004 [Trametopsis cervina]|nr:hypothetical protein BDW22DRAFT_853004 [Trametopsis cervina]